ncbi:hypothetical protein [Mycolicibacterium sp. 120270]|uniref:hypothetical protein n=1 Tax=Mycolicibacterium sp. 120270 TaxID=3090600 RepID=UPI00299F3F17|nr:hypothetical protein [Mycolicibacterium sp. 120270]MDX1887926.1 hypothetical protein [Mycolicibacterium sp. 120270]
MKATQNLVHRHGRANAWRVSRIRIDKITPGHRGATTPYELEETGHMEGGKDRSMPTSRGPKPVVEYEGQTYTARRYGVDVPDLYAMTRLQALVWLNQNTYKRGHSTKTPTPNLAGLKLVVR